MTLSTLWHISAVLSPLGQLETMSIEGGRSNAALSRMAYPSFQMIQLGLRSLISDGNKPS